VSLLVKLNINIERGPPRKREGKKCRRRMNGIGLQLSTANSVHTKAHFYAPTPNTKRESIRFAGSSSTLVPSMYASGMRYISLTKVYESLGEVYRGVGVRRVKNEGCRK